MAADEPRRSGRATKGQHKDLEPSAEPSPKPITKPGAKSKPSKKTAEPTAEDDNDDDSGAGSIRCVCGDTREEPGGILGAFVACDACEAWQHNVCVAVPLDQDQIPDHYFCEQCRPEEHQELLESIERGEKIWEERLKEARNRRKSGGKKAKAKGGRQSRVSGVKAEAEDATSSSPAPPASQESGNKRKFEEEPSHVDTSMARSSPHPEEAAQPQEPRRVSTARDKRRKSSAPDAKLGTDDPDTALVDIEKLPKDRQNVANALSKLFADAIRDRSKTGQFRIPDGHTADSFGKHHASRVEYAIFMNAAESGKYAERFRSILANLKKNAALLERLLKGSLTADELSTMSSQEMASEELQKERALLKEEADKQSVMIREDDKPRMRRTHKGDELVEEGGQATEGTVFSAQPVRHRENLADGDAANAGSPSQSGQDARSPDQMDVDSAQPLERRASSQFDIGNVWAKTQQSPDTEHAQTRFPQQPRRASVMQRPDQQPSRKTEDADVDRLLADDNDDDYTPAEVGNESGVVWRGQLIQPGVADLKVTGRFIAGNDFSRYVKWADILPTALEIEGRLERSKADHYLCGLQWSKRSDVTVIALTPYDDRAAFDSVFEYFASRDRYAVGKKGHNISELVKDLYISPVEIGRDPPPHIPLLDYCGVELPLQERMLFATFVVNKPASWDTLAETSVVDSQPQQPDNGVLPPHLRNQGGPAASPLSAQPPPAFSPRPTQGFTPADPSNALYQGGGQAFGHSPLPPTPYQQQQQHHHHPVQQSYSHPNPLVQSILGPYSGAPVVAQLLTAAGGNLEEHVLRNMRDILEKDPRAREDMGVFTAYLAQGSSYGK